ncbi:MAG: hypothetical protein ACTSWY_08870 [Promethearchaeota archaeon]
MDKAKLLKEAQLIGAQFPFYTVKGKLDHLYGYIYESPDKKTQYPLEIVYDDTFPNNPPQFIFSEEIPGMTDDFQLQTIDNWTPQSHVVEIVQELSVIVKELIEKHQNKANAAKTSEKQEEVSSENSQFEEKIPKTQEPGEFITPNLEKYPIETDVYPEWKPENFGKNNGVTTAEQSTDIIIATETALIQQEYAMDFIGTSAGKVEVYLTITIEQTFIIKINFSEYPKLPKIEMQKGLTDLLGNVKESLDILKKWKENDPPHVVEIIRELESKLWFLSEIELESKKISGEYKTENIDGIISKLKVTLLTYGFKEYTLIIDISKHPAPPKIKYSPELEKLINISAENISGYKNWKGKESHPVEILEEISWLVDKNSRINFELDLLKGGMKEVSYDLPSNTISAKLAGQLKTKDITFDFKVKLMEDHPMSSPHIELLSELEGMEDLREKLTKNINDFVSKWHNFSYLIDLFNQISKAIFEVSVISCVICHQIDCPNKTCGKPISAENEADQCQVMCPSCERLYHKHCWDQTIISFGKCGFCLKLPPPHLRPT